jgi:hypothetical protein
MENQENGDEEDAANGGEGEDERMIVVRPFCTN